ncbi:hypothetical protein GQ457_06G021850 [Hibiscus cannabinus]
MPLYELYRMARGKLDSSQDENPSTSTDLSAVLPENDIVELVWENGQVLMQGMLSKVPKPADDEARSSCGTSQPSPYFRLRNLESTASLQNIGAKATIEENGSKGKGIGASVSSRVDSPLICSNIELQKEEISHCHSTIVPMKTDIKESKAKSQDTPVGTEPNGATAEENMLENDEISNQVIDENDSKRLPHNDMDVESVLAASSVDKASMLDEAIEYLKTLQLQVQGNLNKFNLSTTNLTQIMSMRAALYMPLMMFPTGMQHMHAAAAAHMTHVSPMSVGMGVGMGFGMRFPQMYIAASACPMVQVSPIPGPPFSSPGPHLSGATTLHEMTGSNLHLYGLHGQGLPMSMPGAPLIPIPGEHLMKSTLGLNGCGLVGPMDNKDSSTASSSKDPIQNINSLVTENTNINSSVNQTSTQVRKIFLFLFKSLKR